MAYDEKRYSAKLIGELPTMANVFAMARASRDESEDFRDRVLLLIADVGVCLRSINSNPNDQFWRRMLIRNFFALVEGQIYGMKSLCVHRYNLLDIDFTDADLAYLKEKKFHLNNNGTTSDSDDLYAKLIYNYRFAFRSYEKAFFGGFRLDDSGISNLQELENVRNRLVHPKNLDGLNVSDDDINRFEKVWKWHECETARLFDACKINEGYLPFKDFTGKVKGYLRLTPDLLPDVVMMPDGSVFGFPSRELALAFAEGHSEKHRTNLNFLLYKAEDLERGHPKNQQF